VVNLRFGKEKQANALSYSSRFEKKKATGLQLEEEEEEMDETPMPSVFK
jgi:hypothetical protein